MDCGCCCCKVTVCGNQSSFGSSGCNSSPFQPHPHELTRSEIHARPVAAPVFTVVQRLEASCVQMAAQPTASAAVVPPLALPGSAGRSATAAPKPATAATGTVSRAREYWRGAGRALRDDTSPGPEVDDAADAAIGSSAAARSASNKLGRAMRKLRTMIKVTKNLSSVIGADAVEAATHRTLESAGPTATSRSRGSSISVRTVRKPLPLPAHNSIALPKPPPPPTAEEKQKLQEAVWVEQAMVEARRAGGGSASTLQLASC